MLFQVALTQKGNTFLWGHYQQLGDRIFIQLSLANCGRKLSELINHIQSNEGWISNLTGKYNVVLRSESSASSVALRDFHLPKHFRHLLVKPFSLKSLIKEISDPEDSDSHPLVFLLAQGMAHVTRGFWKISVMLQPRVLLNSSETRGSGHEEWACPCLQE